MKSVLLIGVATLCFAASEPIVSFNSLRTVEASINDKLRSNINDPYEILGSARGTYLERYGAVFTFELNLVVTSPLAVSPFSQGVTEKDIAALHDRKVKKTEALRDSMRGLMLSASKSLPGLPPTERLVMEAFFFNWNWENTRGLSHRLVLTAEKQKLMDAANRRLSDKEMAALFTQEEM